MKKKIALHSKAYAFYSEFASPVNPSITSALILSLSNESTPATIGLMHLWDYREKDLKKTVWGRRHLLEHMLNYGPGKRKISVKAVKANWDKLALDPLRRRLMRLMIWGR